jgi:exopolysaccharide production protein ExoQ
MKVSKNYYINIDILFSNFEKALVIFALFYATSPQTLLLGSDSSSLTQGNLVTQAIWSIIYFFILILIYLRLNSFISILYKEKLIILLVAIAIISFMWSEFPGITLRKSIALFFTTIIGVYIGFRYNTKDQIKLIAVTLSIAAILSTIVIILYPALGIQNTRLHEWRGIYHQKGPFGRFMALGAMTLLILIISSKRQIVVKTFLFAIMSYLMVKAMSVTAIVSFGIVTGSILILRNYWKRWRLTLILSYTILILTALFIIVFIAIYEADYLTGLVGKDTTLSGRISLWSDVIGLAKERALVGYGYNGFWLGWNGPSARIWSTNLWEPNHAHNGFLDVYLDLGLIGLLFLILHLILTIIGSFWYIRVGIKKYLYLWPLLYLQFILINSLTQSVFLTQNSILWIIYIAISSRIIIEFKKHKRSKIESYLIKNDQKLVQAL